MHICLALVQEVHPDVSVTPVLESWNILVDLSHVLHDVGNILLSRIQVRNLSIVQNVVYIFKE